MKAADLLREAVRTAWAARGHTVAAAVVFGLAAAVITLSAGRGAAAEASIRNTMRSTEARLLTLHVETTEHVVPTAALVAVAQRRDVEAVVALGPARDVSRQFDPHALPFTSFRPVVALGEWTTLLELAPRGEPPVGAVLLHEVDHARLGGSLGGLVVDAVESFAIDGIYTPTSPVAGELRGAIRWSRPGPAPFELKTLMVLFRTVEAADGAVIDLLPTLGVSDPRAVSFAPPQIVEDLRRAVEHRLSAVTRGLVVASVATSSAWAGLMTWVWVLSRRRDIGRRRVLGATRARTSTLILLQVLSVALVAGTVVPVVTSLTGTALGQVAVVPPRFLAAQAVVLVAAALVGAALPAWVASMRDPVEAVRSS